MSRARRGDLIVALILIGGLIVLALVLAGTFNVGGTTEGGFSTGPKVGLIDIIGPIYDARDWVEEIDEFRERDNIKAIVIRLDSPGGAVAASQELYEAIRRARDEKPVVASMGNVAASGAYYAALGADSIVANPGSTTGSIGVIMELLVLRELMDTIGIESEVIKSGDLKDAGNPARPLTNRERDYFQDYIDNAYAEFVEVVGLERGLSPERTEDLADGRVFTGRQALEAGLVDILGDQYLAVQLSAQMAGIQEEPVIVRPIRRSDTDWVDLLLGRVIGRTTDRIKAHALFQYRWNAEH